MQRKYNITDEEVIKLYKNKVPTGEIAKLMGSKSSHPLYTILSNHNLLPPRKPLSKPRKTNSINHDYFETIDSHEKAYWLGFICADGHIRKSEKRATTPNRISILIQKSDRILIERIKLALNSKHKIIDDAPLDKRTGKRYERSSIQMYSRKMIQDLFNLGIGEDKSYNCSFPKISEKFYPDFIRGLCDGDGSLGLNQSDNLRVNFLAVEPIALFMINLFREKFNSLIPEMHEVTKNNKILKSFYYSNRYDVTHILDYIYESSTIETRLKRKYDMYLTHKIDFKGTDSKYRWISYHPSQEKWKAMLYPCNSNNIEKITWIGSYNTEEEAYQAQQKYTIDNNIIL